VDVTRKFVLLVAIKSVVLTVIRPEVAPSGTVVVMEVVVKVVITASIPLKATLPPSSKLVPVIVTTVPTGPEVGVKEVMVGRVGLNLRMRWLKVSAI
jgi:hypothetical protein